MNALKTLVFAKAFAVALVMSTGAIAPMTAHASEQDGVTCPSNSQASLSSSNVLTCRKTKVLASICSPLAFTQAGVAVVNSNIVMNPAGSDTCLAVVTGKVVSSVMQPPTPGIDPPASAFHRVINASAPDTFAADQFVYPSGAIFVGDASHGVKCRSGYTTTSISNGRGIRCEQSEVHQATCDGGFNIVFQSGHDQCIAHDIFGNKVIGQYTIPEGVGYIGLTGNPETHGWNLLADHTGNHDYWQKEAKNYQYPVTL